jgi:hypothetical protein
MSGRVHVGPIFSETSVGQTQQGNDDASFVFCRFVLFRFGDRAG